MKDYVTERSNGAVSIPSCFYDESLLLEGLRGVFPSRNHLRLKAALDLKVDAEQREP